MLKDLTASAAPALATAAITPDQIEAVRRARDEYFASGKIEPCVRQFVAESWVRCRGLGLDPRNLRLQPDDSSRLRAARERRSHLMSAAEDLLVLVHRTLGGTPHVLALSDEHGLIMRALGDEQSMGPQGRAANIFEGASWNERDIGCGGIGTCIEAGEPVVLIGAEHFQHAYVDWTCIGIPIRDATGTLVGALDFSVPNPHANVHTWGWMLSVARAVEDRLRKHRSDQAGQASFDRRSGHISRADGTDSSTDLPPDRPLNAARGLLEMIGRHCVGQSEVALERLKAEVGEAEDRFCAALACLLGRHENLEQTARTKDEFIAALGHELRGPLFALRSCVQTLKSEGDDTEAVRWAVGILEQQVRHVGRLVEDLMDLGRIERGKVEPRPETFALSCVLKQAMATVRDDAEARSITIRTDVPELQIRADRARIVQVLTNLLTNAVRYNRDGGQIFVKVNSRDDGTVELRIADTGQGLEADILPRIFDPFVQGKARNREGLGLGLALVRQLVELHGGMISAHSDGPGKGSEFILRLPIAAESFARRGKDDGELLCA